MDRTARIAIVGAGLGGLTLAGLLHRDGWRVDVYEQAPRFYRIGAGIVLGPSIFRVMMRLGVGPAFVTAGIRPDAFVSRAFDTGETLNELTLGAEYEARVGGPLVNIHRADLHAVLRAALPDNAIRYEHRLSGLDVSGGPIRLRFENGAVEEADIVVGADGIRSRVRDCAFGARRPRYTGRVAHRAVFPAARAADVVMRDCTKWWGTDRHVLAYYMTERRDEIYIMGASPSDAFDADSAPTPCTAAHFVDAFEDFHPELLRLAEACEDVTLLPICDLERDDRWCEGRIALIGDACHAVRPFMAAGGSMAIEDAAILYRCLGAFDDPAQAFSAYEAARIPRVGEVQRISMENSWLKAPGETDWFFAYDPFDERFGEGVYA